MEVALAVIACGLLVTVVGLYIYVAKPPAWLGRGLIFEESAVACALPSYGIGLMLVGIALIVRHGPLAHVLLAAAFFLMAAGVVFRFWQPYWARPKRLRDRQGSYYRP
jgi:hypothetical protein